MFRDDFVWGVASSSYQIEGSDPEDGMGKNVWDTFMEKGKMKDKGDAKVSCDHIHHYKEDYRLMNNLGIKAYRFSLSWARIIPNGVGKVNQKGIQLYRDMILEMKKNGITPYITLYHWELPQALEDCGGWLNEEIIEWFAEYARVVVENFGDLCDYFITINEPQCFVGIGYMQGAHAPGKTLPMKDIFQIAHNVLRAHGRAVINMRKYAGKKIYVGYAPTCGVAYPISDRPEDVEAARKVYFGFYQPDENWTWNVSWFSDPVFLGHYPEEGMKKYAEYLPKITQEDMDLIYQPLDFMGQNIYNGYYIQAGKDGNPEYANRPIGFPITASKWPITPECLYYGCKFIYERYHLPIFITENGLSCADNVALDGQVHDTNRIEFLDLYISQLQRAVDEGVDVRGYFLWTFCDNFEWEKGYTERFGIVWVDFQTQERIAKDSAYWYQKMMETNGANLSINHHPRTLLFFEPKLIKRVWGGNRLKKEWGFEGELEDHIGECWVVSSNEQVDCVVNRGFYKGKKLSELWNEEPDLFDHMEGDEFPLLVKLIDAKEDLSLQVHPDDAYAGLNENGSGKRECWYVLDCPEDATLAIGNKAQSLEEFSRLVSEGAWDQLINEVPIKKGDFIQIEPGTLHAIKAGFMLLEIQQNSDITYRIYDYDRVCEDTPRELNIEKGLQVMKVPNLITEEDIFHPVNTKNVIQRLIMTDHYQIWSLEVAAPLVLQNEWPFLIVSVVEGDGLVDGTQVSRGNHFIIPNGYKTCKIQGSMKLVITAPVI